MSLNSAMIKRLNRFSADEISRHSGISRSHIFNLRRNHKSDMRLETFNRLEKALAHLEKSALKPKSRRKQDSIKTTNR